MTEAPFSYSRTPVTLAIERRCRFGRFANKGASVKASSRRVRSSDEIRAPEGIGVNGHPRTAGSMRSSSVLGAHYASRIGFGATWNLFNWGLAARAIEGPGDPPAGLLAFDP